MTLLVGLAEKYVPDIATQAAQPAPSARRHQPDSTASAAWNPTADRIAANG